MTRFIPPESKETPLSISRDIMEILQDNIIIVMVQAREYLAVALAGILWLSAPQVPANRLRPHPSGMRQYLEMHTCIFFQQWWIRRVVFAAIFLPHVVWKPGWMLYVIRRWSCTTRFLTTDPGLTISVKAIRLTTIDIYFLESVTPQNRSWGNKHNTAVAAILSHVQPKFSFE